MQLNNRFK